MAYTGTVNEHINKVWRKSQGKLVPGFNFATPEFGWISDFKTLQIDASLREMTFPVDLNEDRNITMLPESGRMAHPSSVNAVDATVQFTHANGRFSAGFLAKWASQADGGAGEIEKQITFQGRKKVEAMTRVLGDQVYGFSTGVLGVVATYTAGPPQSVTLKNGYGSTLIPGTLNTQKKYIANLVKKGDRIAFIRAGALVANGIVEISTDPSPTTAGFEFTTTMGAVTPAVNDEIVFANGANASTIAHTSYQLHLTGLLEFCTADSVHGISKTLEPNWDVALGDTSGSRFNGQRWRQGVDEIQNFGNADASPLTLMNQGVYRDVLAQYQAGIRYNDPFDIEIDGEIKGRGKLFKMTRRVPPGMVFMYDANKGAIKKKTIHDDMEAPGWGDGQPQIDDAFWTFPIDWAGFLCTTNRKLFAYWTGLQEFPIAA